MLQKRLGRRRAHHAIRVLWRRNIAAVEVGLRGATEILEPLPSKEHAVSAGARLDGIIDKRIDGAFSVELVNAIHDIVAA